MERIDAWRRRARWGLTVFYGAAGILHLVVPKPFIGITPSWVPEPAEVIVLTGLCELLGAVALLAPAARKYAGIGLALYAVCVYPANIKHAVDSLGAGSVSPWQWIYHTVRLPLQLVLCRSHSNLANTPKLGFLQVTEKKIIHRWIKTVPVQSIDFLLCLKLFFRFLRHS